MDRLIALNANNGAVLWGMESPDLRRLNMPRDASNWCADGEHVFLAYRDQCWRIDAASGNVSHVYPVLAAAEVEWPCDWSYVAQHGDLLLGSSTKQGSAYTAFWGSGAWYNTSGYAKVCSDNLFALDKQTGQTRWRYDRGVIINTAVAISDERLYLVESRNEEVKRADHRVIDMAPLWQDLFLVALDVSTGEKLWEKPLTVHAGDVMFSLASSSSKLVLVSNGGGAFHIHAYHAADGAERGAPTRAVWRRSGMERRACITPPRCR